MKNTQKTVDELRPIDDTFIRKLAEDREVCEELLQIVTGNPKLRVVNNTIQKNIHNIDTRSVTVDLLCTDEENDYFSVEVQKADDDHQKRVRYNGACVQILSLEKGMKFGELPDVYMVYITEKDIFKRGRTIYHFDRVIRETQEVMDNGYYEIYVNAEVYDGTELAEYMEIFSSMGIHEDTRFPKICSAVKYYKQGKGRETMCAAVEEYAREYAEEKALETARRLLERHVDEDIIVEATGITLEKLSELKK